MRHRGGRGCEQVGSDVMRRDGSIPEVRDSALRPEGSRGLLWRYRDLTPQRLTLTPQSGVLL